MNTTKALYDLTIQHESTLIGAGNRDRAIKAIMKILSTLEKQGLIYDYDIEYDPETSDWLNEGDNE